MILNEISDKSTLALDLTHLMAFNVFARQFVARCELLFAVTTPVPTEHKFAAKMNSIYLSMCDSNASEHKQ